jgi:hypothetical protein
MLGQQRREATRQRLAGVETAIALFVSQNQRLPCPANGTLAGTDSNAGIEQKETVSAGPPIIYRCAVGGVSNSQQHGVVPWRALGISEQDATDGWGNRLTYRVSPDFVSSPSMNGNDDSGNTGCHCRLLPVELHIGRIPCEPR